MNSPQKVFVISSILVLAVAVSEGFPNSEDDYWSANPRLIELPQIEGESHCAAWMTAADNAGRWWRTVPEECVEYVQEYMLSGKGYDMDVGRVSDDAGAFARSVNLTGDGKDVWIFDVDETLLSNLPYYARHGFGSEKFDSKKFDEWVESGAAASIKASLKLYEEVLNLGFVVILLTGRSEGHRNITVDNLLQAGFHHWTKLIMRSTEDHGKTAVEFKSIKRNELVEEGFRILGNSGDQWSDLLGSAMSQRSFKLPNPMYYIP
ncbi:acid phosphatase 1-like [Andrographis paniculata]|uniref:acid phosphatase 1-like n=1 Tax=Andrographis paniculata TaxID=175694 RepID=UPI0021E8B8D3|nr:acid phosphatase 1-like [Andrographis paniculata]